MPISDITGHVKTASQAIPQIYSYSTPEIKRHDGWTKIGYTERDVEERVKHLRQARGARQANPLRPYFAIRKRTHAGTGGAGIRARHRGGNSQGLPGAPRRQDPTLGRRAQRTACQRGRDRMSDRVYSIEIASDAAAYFAALPTSVQSKVIHSVDLLATTPFLGRKYAPEYESAPAPTPCRMLSAPGTTAQFFYTVDEDKGCFGHRVGWRCPHGSTSETWHGADA